MEDFSRPFFPQIFFPRFFFHLKIVRSLWNLVHMSYVWKPSRLTECPFQFSENSSSIRPPGGNSPQNLEIQDIKKLFVCLFHICRVATSWKSPGIFFSKNLLEISWKFEIFLYAFLNIVDYSKNWKKFSDNSANVMFKNSLSVLWHTASVCDCLRST